MHALRPSASALAAGLALLGLATSALARDDFETRLRSVSEVPSVLSPASGRFEASVDHRSNSMTYKLSYSGLQGDVRQGHIHIGQKGANGGIMVWLCQTSINPDPTGLAPQCPQSGTVTGVIQAANVVGMAAGQGVDAMDFGKMLTAIRSGVAYVNVHTSKFTGGEVRGQLHDD
jgi:CHRD domain